MCASKSLEAHLSIISLVPMPFPFEAHRTPNVTYITVSAPLALWIIDPCCIWLVSSRPLRPVSDRQTLRVCGQSVRRPFQHPCHAACQLAKRYVCAASAFPAVAASDGPSVWTRRRPPNVTHVMVFVSPRRFHETLSNPMKYQQFHRRTYPFEPLRAPNLRERKGW